MREEIERKCREVAEKLLATKDDQKRPVTLEDIFKVVCEIRDMMARPLMSFTPPKQTAEDEEKIAKVRESMDKMRNDGWMIVPAHTSIIHTSMLDLPK